MPVEWRDDDAHPFATLLPIPEGGEKAQRGDRGERERRAQARGVAVHQRRRVSYHASHGNAYDAIVYDTPDIPPYYPKFCPLTDTHAQHVVVRRPVRQREFCWGGAFALALVSVNTRVS